MGHHRLRAAAGASPADPYFSSTSLLLLGNGTNGGQNNTFVDGSTNNFTITRNGNTTQGTFSPFSAPDGRWSNYFDGNGDYLTTPSSSAFAFGTGDYTMECWIYPLDQTYGRRVFEMSDNKDNIDLNINGSGSIDYYNGSTTTSSSSGAIALNAWNHVACVRYSGTVKIYVNGTSVLTQATTPNTTANRLVYIAGGANNWFNGYISNVRILKGTAQYTTTFTPPTAPLTAITNTSLLTCQSNRFKDNSSNAFTITPSGNAAVTSFSPFAPTAEYSASTNGGSGYFDGSGDYLRVANGAGLQLGSGNFTIEFWFYAFNFNTDYFFIATNTGPSLNANCSYTFASISSGQMVYALSSSGTSWNLINTTMGIGLTANSWNHIALVRNGSSILPYVNGVLGTTQTTSSSLYDFTSPVWIGSVDNLASYFLGYISNMRIVKGTALYSGSSFAVPTEPLTAVTNTSLLLNFTNASIIDSTGKNDLETVGDAQISTSVKKFGTGSLKFDGTGDYLSIPSNSNLAFGTGDFTIELWAYLNSQGTFIIYDPRTTEPQIVPVIYTYLGQIRFYVNGVDRIVGSTLSATTWHHIAVCRSGSSTKLFVNGTQSGSTYSDSNNYIQTRVVFCVYPGDLTSYFNGYLDDIRITKGVARYTSAFTPPSAQLPAR